MHGMMQAQIHSIIETKYEGLYNIKEIHRITSATTMNAHSSRSHAIFTVYLQVILMETKDKM